MRITIPLSIALSATLGAQGGGLPAPPAGLAREVVEWEAAWSRLATMSPAEFEEFAGRTDRVRESTRGLPPDTRRALWEFRLEAFAEKIGWTSNRPAARDRALIAEYRRRSFLSSALSRGADDASRLLVLRDDAGRVVGWDAGDDRVETWHRAAPFVIAVVHEHLDLAARRLIDAKRIESRAWYLEREAVDLVASSALRILSDRDDQERWLRFTAPEGVAGVVGHLHGSPLSASMRLEELAPHLFGDAFGGGGAKASARGERGDLESDRGGVKSAEAVPGGPATEPYRTVRLFFGTNRKHTGERDPQEAYGGEPGPLELGACEVSIPATHKLGELEAAPWYRRDNPAKDVLLRGIERALTVEARDALFAEMARFVQASSAQDTFVFVHGYNVSFEHAARRTAQIAHDLKFPGAPIFYSWPSEGDFEDYAADWNDAEVSAPKLAQFLEIVARESKAERIHLIAHSMGSRALGYAIRHQKLTDVSVQFSQIVLAAPDIDATVFKEQIFPIMKQRCDQITLYASDKDKALMASQLLAQSPRAGQAGEHLVIMDGLVTIDASKIDTDLLGLNHSYFSEVAAVVADIARVLAGDPPHRRALLNRARGMLGYWLLPAG